MNRIIKRIIITLVVIFISTGCDKEVVTKKPEQEIPKKIVCTMSALGENTAIFEYMHDSLISYQSRYLLKVNSERAIEDKIKEWKYLEPLKGVKGVVVNWGINDDRTEMELEIIAYIQEINIEDLINDTYSGIDDLVQDKDNFDWEQTKEMYESLGFTCN